MQDMMDITFVNQSELLVSKGVSYFSQYFNTYKFNTVTTDAIYRQTFFKEDYWRKMDCVGVDMEASALISVSNYYNIEPNVILLVSDKHPVKKEDKNWVWGNPNFKSIKDKFINSSIKYAINNEQY